MGRGVGVDKTCFITRDIQSGSREASSRPYQQVMYVQERLAADSGVRGNTGQSGGGGGGGQGKGSVYTSSGIPYTQIE